MVEKRHGAGGGRRLGGSGFTRRIEDDSVARADDDVSEADWDDDEGDARMREKRTPGMGTMVRTTRPSRPECLNLWDTLLSLAILG